MLNNIFDIIMRFHKRYNTAANYTKLLSLSGKYGAKITPGSKVSSLVRLYLNVLWYLVWQHCLS